MKINLRAYEAYILKRALDNLEDDLHINYEGRTMHHQTFQNKKNSEVTIVYLKEKLGQIVRSELDDTRGKQLERKLEEIKGFRALVTMIKKRKGGKE